MANYFGINSDYDFFGNANGSSLLSDYALIRNGAYKKLMNAYYGTGSSTSHSSIKEETVEEKQEKLNLKSTKTAAEGLKTAAASLRNGKIFEPVKNKETGEMEINKKKMEESISAFVKSYNETIEATGEVDATSVLRKTLWMIDDVKANAGLLEDAGITIGQDNKLALNTEKLGEAKISTLKSLFSGSGSVADKIMKKASELGRLSDAAVNSVSKKGVSYTSKGDYESLNTSTIYDSFF